MYPILYFIFSSIFIFVSHKLYVYIQQTFTTTKVIDIVDKPKKHIDQLESIEKNNKKTIINNLENDFEKHLETIPTHEKNNSKKITTIDNLEMKANKTHNTKNKNTKTNTSTPISEINEVVSHDNDNRFHQHIQSNLLDEPHGNNMKEELADYLDNFDV